MNALETATSSYLLAHKDNPVQWRMWSSEVLAEAEQTGKPIFLSIGYGACHWCHVMNRESFSDPETAQLINENFIPVIADRVQRPDLDQLYQAASNVMGHNGGWPLNIFLNAKGQPFFVGGYLPKEERLGQPAFSRVLTDMAAMWRDKPEDVAKNAQAVFDSLSNLLDRDMHGPTDGIQLDIAALRMGQRYDIFLGGQLSYLSNGGMKFPQTIFLEILWRAYLRSGISQFCKWSPPPSTRRCWAVFTIMSAAVSSAIRRTSAGWCRISRRCWPTMPCWSNSLPISGSSTATRSAASGWRKPSTGCCAT